MSIGDFLRIGIGKKWSIDLILQKKFFVDFD